MLRKKLFLSTILFFLSGFLHCQVWDKELWTYLKYETAHESDHKKIIKEYLEKTPKPKNQSEKIWFFMTQSTLASVTGGLSAVSILSNAKDDIEPLLQDPETDQDFMACAVLSYIYSKVPGWPLGFGSTKTAKRWLKRAHQKEYNPDVAFYIAQTYHHLGNDKQAQLFAKKSLDGFQKEDSVYNKGKIKEIQNFDFL